MSQYINKSHNVTIKRSAFEVNWGLVEKFTDDDIKVNIQVEAIKQ